MSISVLTLLIVYLRYNALYIKLTLFALYNNIFFMKVSKTENRFKTCFQQPKTGFPKKPVLTSLNRTSFLFITVCIRSALIFSLFRTFLIMTFIVQFRCKNLLYQNISTAVHL